MTREFNKQHRDDSRPSFRKPSSGRYGEERAPRPARPRLNRETVDRAWESGAQTNHADYRPRTTSKNNEQSSRNNWRHSRDGQQREYSSQNGRGGNRPYASRSDSYRDNQDNRNTPRRFENQAPRARSFDSGRRNFNDQRFDEHRDSSYGNGSRQGYRDNAPSRGREERYPSRERGYQARDVERDGRDPRRFEREQRDDRRPRSFERGRDNSSDGQSRYGQNPRWQNRPARPAARHDDTQGRRSFGERDYDDARFEGDYEGMRNGPAPRRPQRSFGRPQYTTNYQQQKDAEPEERHVTHLADGRVLKGPRPVQRKNAEFWNNISEDTDALLNTVHVPAPENEVAQTELGDQQATTTTEGDEQAAEHSTEATPTKSKGRTHVASAAVRAKKPRSTGPKPSQRGFKWPTSET